MLCKCYILNHVRSSILLYYNYIENLEKVLKRPARFVTGNYRKKSGMHRFNLELIRMAPIGRKQTPD